MSNNITLIGMPGSGKSSYGVVVAKKMGYGFVDSDLVIQAKYGKLLWQIIEEKGLEGFLEIEEETNSAILGENLVIAPGGSVIYGEKAMKHFKEIGKVVYLNQPIENLLKSVGDLGTRGVAMKEGQTFEDLYAERTPLYEKYADIVIDCKDKDGSAIVDEIISRIRA
ncbi:shikimate kinase [Lachnospiraceae bacterium G11]|nr:shikimate kinase [Lachnospiraceae bacterium G11]